MGYYSDFYIDLTIKGTSEATVKDIVEHTFGKWVANQLCYSDPNDGAFVWGTIDGSKWYSFTEDVKAFRKAIVEAGGEFTCGNISRQGEDAEDGERFVAEDGRLVRQVAQVTWVTTED